MSTEYWTHFSNGGNQNLIVLVIMINKLHCSIMKCFMLANFHVPTFDLLHDG